MSTKKDHPGARPPWQLCLYVAGHNSISIRAFMNLRKFCNEQLAGKCKIEVVDVGARPQLARTQNIVAVPTLVRTFPKPMRMVIGDLSDSQQIIKGLDLRLSA
jgi:circadian clock protein KaiB